MLRMRASAAGALPRSAIPSAIASTRPCFQLVDAICLTDCSATVQMIRHRDGLLARKEKEKFPKFSKSCNMCGLTAGLPWECSMGPFASRCVFIFDKHRLNRRGGGLFREGEEGALLRIALGSRALEILALLLERSGDLVTKEEIFAAVWP